MPTNKPPKTPKGSASKARIQGYKKKRQQARTNAGITKDVYKKQKQKRRRLWEQSQGVVGTGVSTTK